MEFIALWPLSILFRAGVGLRSAAYRMGILPTRRESLPVVSIGNLAVGGTGKTPFTLWLARMLSARGFRVAIVLRGYGGKRKAVTVVSDGAGPLLHPAEVGDEAVMLARSFAGVVITAARRADGARVAADLGCDVVVLDDGFQHRALARQFDIVLVDNRHRSLLPAGPLRESWSALGRADAIVLSDRGGQERHRTRLPRRARSKPVYSMRIEPTCLVELIGKRWVERPLGLLVGKRVIAVSGIGQPEAFYELIRQWEAEIHEFFEYRDHHQYTQENWQQIGRRAQWVDFAVTTEKDLVKLEAFPFATGKLFALRIEPRIDRSDDLIDLVVERAGLRHRNRLRNKDVLESNDPIDLLDVHTDDSLPSRQDPANHGADDEG